jgi:hypothetical protein
LRVTQSTFTDDEGQLWVPVVPNTLAVYRNLRIGLSVTAVMLAASIIIQSTYMRRLKDKHCVQGALSEYFYTSAHSIFIAALLGLATLFFIYRGTSDTENALFKLGGIGAFVAALVPQPKTPIDKCTPLFLPDDFDVDSIVRPNLSAVVIALILAWVITLFPRKHDPKDINGRRIPPATSPGGNWARCILRLVVVVGLIALIFPGLHLLKFAHGAAGVLLLSSSIATVFVTAFFASREVLPRRRKAHRCCYQVFYWVWAIVMLVTLIGVLAVHICRPDIFRGRGVTVVESAVLLEFCAYWVVQTIDLWDDPDRRYRLSTADRERLAGTHVRIAGEPDGLCEKVMSFL